MRGFLATMAAFLLAVGCQDKPQPTQDLAAEQEVFTYTTRPTGETSSELGYFFDDFDEVPKHRPKTDERIYRYSRGSIVDKKSLDTKRIQGEKALELTLFPDQWHEKIRGYRAEMVLHGGNPNNDIRWYEFSFMIPEDYELDEENFGKEVNIMQLHYVRPKGEEKIINQPTVALLYVEQYGKNILLLRYGVNGEEGNRLEGQKWHAIALTDEFQKGVWNKMRLQVKWSQKSDGFIAAWLNDRPFTGFNGLNNRVYGANMYNDIPVNLKFGNYRYWKNSKATKIYYDYLKIAPSFKTLTGFDATSERLYGKQDDYRYLEGKRRVLHDVQLRENDTLE